MAHDAFALFGRVHFPQRLPQRLALAHGLTLLGVVLTRILFVAKDFSQAGVVFKSLVNFGDMGFPIDGIATLLLRVVISCFILFFMPMAKTLSDRFRPTVGRLVPLTLAAGLSVALMGRTSSFLYFQF